MTEKKQRGTFSKPEKAKKVLTSDFATRVYAVVAKIPKGKTMTYSQVAKAVGSPAASRAVGTVLSKNWNPKIPCHRVIRSDGKMGGYNRGGIEKKQKILAHERQT